MNISTIYLVKPSVTSTDSFKSYFFLENIENDQTLTDEIASILTTLQTTTSRTQAVQTAFSTVSSLTPTSTLATTSSATNVPTTSASQTVQGTTSITPTVSQQVTSITATSAINLNNSSALSNSATRNDIITSILLILSSFLLRI